MNIFYLSLSSFLRKSALDDFLCLVFIIDLLFYDFSDYFNVILFHLEGLSVLECYNLKNKDKKITVLDNYC